MAGLDERFPHPHRVLYDFTGDLRIIMIADRLHDGQCSFSSVHLTQIIVEISLRSIESSVSHE